MTTYRPAAEILPESTDEDLRSGRFFGPDVAALLLRVPAELRQPVEAEVNRRAYRTGYVATAGGLMATQDQMRNVDDVRREVVAEVLAQLDREGVTR